MGKVISIVPRLRKTHVSRTSELSSEEAIEFWRELRQDRFGSVPLALTAAFACFRRCLSVVAAFIIACVATLLSKTTVK